MRRACPPNAIVQRGIAQVPQGREVWPSMTVHDNLELGAVTRRDWAAIRTDIDEIFELFPKLAPHQEAARRRVERRRAADGRDRPRLDGKAALPADG